MKILICLHHFLPEYIGGTEIYTLRLAQGLRQAGVEAVIVVPRFGHSDTAGYEYEGIRVIAYAENSVEDRKMIMGKTKPGGLAAFVDVLHKENPAIVHFHELAPGRGINIFHVEKTNELNIPLIITFHLAAYTCMKGSLVYKDIKKCDGLIRIKACTECVLETKGITGIKATLLAKASVALYTAGLDPTKLNSTPGTALGFPYVIDKIKNDLLKLSKLAAKIIVLSEWYKNILEKNGVPSAKLLYIRQGLAKEVPRHFNNSGISVPLKIVFIGRITAIKGLHLLIRAMGQLPQEKISLHIYGRETNDDYVANCKKQSASMQNIHWMGAIPSEEVIATLSNYHVLCLPSDFEMSPLVIQEAFAAGLPVLASDVYGNAEHIREGENGWLFRFKDSSHLAEKLKYLLDDVKRVERARLNLPVPKMFTEIAREHVWLYSEIAREKELVDVK
ncbi:MAG: glycosyltransferase [Ferruginibacter sp.]